jgi:pyruvate kinase
MLRDKPPSLAGLIEPVTEAAVDAACLMSRQLDAALVVVAAKTGRTALSLSNRRPSATIFALSQSEQVARALSLCWGITATVVPETSSAEQLMAFTSEWAKSHGLVHPGQHAVLLREVSGHANARAVLAGEVK